MASEVCISTISDYEERLQWFENKVKQKGKKRDSYYTDLTKVMLNKAKKVCKCIVDTVGVNPFVTTVDGMIQIEWQKRDSHKSFDIEIVGDDIVLVVLNVMNNGHLEDELELSVKIKDLSKIEDILKKYYNK